MRKLLRKLIVWALEDDPNRWRQREHTVSITLPTEPESTEEFDALVESHNRRIRAGVWPSRIQM